MAALFDASDYRVGDLHLGPFTPDRAADMAARLAAIDPWARLGIGASALAEALALKVAGAPRFEVVRAGRPVAVLALRSPWLYGPYIALLAVMPEAQGQGIGGRLLDFVEAQARAAGDGNVWVAASSFNDAAIAFYRRFGFAKVGPMPDLVRPGFTEILLRKPLCVQTDEP